MIPNYLVLIIFSQLLMSCGPEELSFNREDYLGEELGFSGFYWDSTDYEYFMFFQNGVYLTGNETSNNNIDKVKDFYSDYEQHKYIYDLPYGWGAFKEENSSSLYMEGWTPSDGGGGYPIIQHNAENVTKNRMFIDAKEFYFQPMQAKPDSIVKWIN